MYEMYEGIPPSTFHGHVMMKQLIQEPFAEPIAAEVMARTSWSTGPANMDAFVTPRNPRSRHSVTW
jgi:hypothetical protein